MCMIDGEYSTMLTQEQRKARKHFVKAIVAIRALAAAPGGGVVQHMNPSFSEPKGTPDRRVRRLDRRALPPSLVQLDRERSNG